MKKDAWFGSYSPHSGTLRTWWVAVARHLKSKYNTPQFLLNSSLISRWIITPHASMSSKAWASLESASTDSGTGGEHSLESEAFVWLPLLLLCAVGWHICELHMASPGSSDSFLEHHVTSRDCGLTLTCHAITHAKTVLMNPPPHPSVDHYSTLSTMMYWNTAWYRRIQLHKEKEQYVLCLYEHSCVKRFAFLT